MNHGKDGKDNKKKYTKPKKLIEYTGPTQLYEPIGHIKQRKNEDEEETELVERPITKPRPARKPKAEPKP